MLSRPTRLLTLLFAAIQFAGPAALSIADGDMAGTDRVTTVHIENFGQTRCKPPHSADCLICRFLGAVHSQPATASPSLLTREIAVAPTTLLAQFGTSTRRGFNSRAPPSLLD